MSVEGGAARVYKIIPSQEGPDMVRVYLNVPIWHPYKKDRGVTGMTDSLHTSIHMQCKFAPGWEERSGGAWRSAICSGRAGRKQSAGGGGTGVVGTGSPYNQSPPKRGRERAGQKGHPQTTQWPKVRRTGGWSLRAILD